MDLEANRMTSEWTLLLFSKIKKRYFLGTKIRKLKAKIKKWQLKNLTSMNFFLLCHWKWLRKVNRKMVKNTKKIGTQLFCSAFLSNVNNIKA